MESLGCISSTRTKPQTSGGGGDGGADGSSGRVQDSVEVQRGGGVTVNAELESGAGGETEPPDPRDRGVVSATTTAGGQAGGETHCPVGGGTQVVDVVEAPPVLHTADNKVLEAASYMPCLDESDSNNEETAVPPLTELEQQVVLEQWAEMEETVGRFLRESRREAEMNNSTEQVIPTLQEQNNHTAITQQVVTPLPEQNNNNFCVPTLPEQNNTTMTQQVITPLLEQNNHTAITQQAVTPLPEQNNNNFSHQQQATPPQQSLSPTWWLCVWLRGAVWHSPT